MNMQSIMAQAQKMQRQMEEQQKELETKEFTATAGGGAVSATVSGKKEITAFVQKASMLKIGMSEQEVLKLLGRPTSIQKSGSIKGNKTIMIFWNYYLIKKDDNGVNEKYDAYLMLIFSPEKMVLTKIIFSKGSAYV
mgnify:CR=1 FL=1